MALFGKKKEAAKAETPVERATVSRAAASVPTGNYRDVLKHARITEKATMQQGAGVYVFDVTADATKRDIVRAMQAVYKVTPRKVAVVTVKAKEKRNMRTGRAGISGGGKKAYIYLKGSDTINL